MSDSTESESSGWTTESAAGGLGLWLGRINGGGLGTEITKLGSPGCASLRALWHRSKLSKYIAILMAIISSLLSTPGITVNPYDSAFFIIPRMSAFVHPAFLSLANNSSEAPKRSLYVGNCSFTIALKLKNRQQSALAFSIFFSFGGVIWRNLL
jgi:hypothetical protein